MLAQPVLQVEVVELLRPQHARQRLPVHAALILVQGFRCDPLVEFVGLGNPPIESSLEPVECIVDGGARQTQPDGAAAAGRHVKDVVGRGLGAHSGRVDGIGVPGDDVGVEGIFDIRGGIGLAPQTVRVAFVLGEEQLRGSVTRQLVLAKLRV